EGAERIVADEERGREDADRVGVTVGAEGERPDLAAIADATEERFLPAVGLAKRGAIAVAADDETATARAALEEEEGAFGLEVLDELVQHERGLLLEAEVGPARGDDVEERRELSPRARRDARGGRRALERRRLGELELDADGSRSGEGAPLAGDA